MTAVQTQLPAGSGLSFEEVEKNFLNAAVIACRQGRLAEPAAKGYINNISIEDVDALLKESGKAPEEIGSVKALLKNSGKVPEERLRKNVENLKRGILYTIIYNSVIEKDGYNVNLFTSFPKLLSDAIDFDRIIYGKKKGD